MKFVSEYEAHLRWIDSLTHDVLKHAPPAAPHTDLYRADLAGLLAVSYVAAFENSVKSILTCFAASKHKILGNVAIFHFEKINSKIHWQALGDIHVAQFGANYRAKFLICSKERKACFSTQRR
jgi:hypothetical protein